ncbi:DUF1015 family protein [Desulfofundulus thermobenzoicus]|uniref:DUF1015 family protein n=1 Tax=Desulfofundulus thermobenzoicus TaxID=29376 RepID=A0A6N7ITR5_9FIRM|nr:DUF1015 domain-containing protein [Desulfofundulus thermobenzoicus]MQL53474.1 DUF1015 family protein [Desulfofundulus thermobenzoicus]
MAGIIPLRGLRYAPGVGSMADLVTPPYDVIDSAAQEEYYRRHPFNIIRLEYGKIHPGDDEKNNRYTRAAADFAAWLEKGVLAAERAPALYLYEQEFTTGGRQLVRSGMICGVRLEPYEKGVVLPHEETLPRHKADRLALMRACRANFSPVFGLYADPEMTVDNLLRRGTVCGAAQPFPGEYDVTGASTGGTCSPETGRAPDVSFTDEYGHNHRLWVITDPVVIEQVQQALTDRRIFIADGHHRYETALAYARERREQEGNFAGDGPYDYIMMTLVNLYDPGLVILPTHRLVANVDGLDMEELLEKIGEHFVVEPFALAPGYGHFGEFLRELAGRGGCAADGQTGSAAFTGQEKGCGGGTDSLVNRPAEPEAGESVVTGDPGRRERSLSHRHAFGLYCGRGRLYLLTLRDEGALPGLMPAGRSAAWQGLDVSVLHHLILEGVLGIGGAEREKESHLTYTREEEGALRAVDDGRYQLAFFLNPTLVEEVTAVAAAGEKMPQKSTFFYPKLLTGLVINPLY